MVSIPSFSLKLFRFLVSIFLTCFVSGFAELGFDTTDPLTKDQFKCIIRSGFPIFIGRVYDPAGFVDENGFANLANAMQAGSPVNAYMSPCASGNCKNNITAPADQVELVVNRLLNLGIPRPILFVDIKGNWSDDQGQNQNFIFGLVNAIANVKGIDAGVMSSQGAWFSAFGKFFIDVSYVAKSLLWVNWNGKPDYSGYNSFGGWTLYGHEYAGGITTNNCAPNATLNYIYLQ